VPKWLLDPDGPLAVRPGHFLRFIPWGVRFLLNGQSSKTVERISDAMAALSRNNTSLYADHLRGTGSENLLRPCRYILAYRNADAIKTDGLDFKLRLRAGAIMEIADDRRLRELEPALSRDFKAALVMNGPSRAASPGDLRDALIDKAVRHGCVLHRASATALKPDNGGWLVETDNGPVRCTRLLLTAGAWSRELLKPLGPNVPLEFEYGYHIEIAGSGVTLDNIVMDTTTKAVANLTRGGLRVSSFADFRGPGSRPDNRHCKILVRYAHAMFPDVNTSSYKEWGGPRPSFPDSLPAIGQVPDRRNLFVAFGHSHFGLGMAPRTGQLISRIIAGEDPGVDMRPYAVNRF